jgi:fructose-1,6-bisphosphatase/sedoheptulose 1,7-bisphosphatase-like protein
MAPEVRTERELSLDFLRVTEAAAIAAARTMGQGDRKYSDQVAVEAMREVMDSVRASATKRPCSLSEKK